MLVNFIETMANNMRFGDDMFAYIRHTVRG